MSRELLANAAALSRVGLTGTGKGSVTTGRIAVPAVASAYAHLTNALLFADYMQPSSKTIWGSPLVYFISSGCFVTVADSYLMLTYPTAK